MNRGTQSKADSPDARDRRATRKFRDVMDKWTIIDFARTGSALSGICIAARNTGQFAIAA